MRRFGWMAGVLFLSFGLVNPVYASKHLSNDQTVWSEINDLTSEVWELGKIEHYDEAADVLIFASKTITDAEEVAVLRPDQQRLVFYTLKDALATLQNPDWSKEKKMNKLTEVRFLVDALQTDYEPLWKKTGLMMLEPFITMQKEIADKNADSFQIAVNLLLQRYETIRPALSVDLSMKEMDRLDKHISFVDNNRAAIMTDEEQQKQLEIAAADFEALFFAKKDHSEPSLFWLIFSIGGIISSTLVYVGWRKYKGDKEEELRVPQKR
jgi:sporulation protein YpjB